MINKDIFLVALSWLKPPLKLQRNKAQGFVEFALALPILLILIFGMVDFGRLLFIYSAVYTSSREGARYGSAAGSTPGGIPRYIDCNGITAAAMRLGSFAGVESSDVVITYDHGPNPDFDLDNPDPALNPNTEEFTTCQDADPDDIVGGLDRVIVRVTTGFQPIAPLINLPSFPITSESRRTVIKNIQVYGVTPTPP